MFCFLLAFIYIFNSQYFRYHHAIWIFTYLFIYLSIFAILSFFQGDFRFDKKVTKNEYNIFIIFIFINGIPRSKKPMSVGLKKLYFLYLPFDQRTINKIKDVLIENFTMGMYSPLFSLLILYYSIKSISFLII